MKCTAREWALMTVVTKGVDGAKSWETEYEVLEMTDREKALVAADIVRQSERVMDRTGAGTAIKRIRRRQ